MKRRTRGMALMAWMVLCGAEGSRAGDATTPGMDEASAKVSADKPDDTATWKRTTKEQAGFTRKLTVNIAEGYVLAEAPDPPAADPGSLWILDPKEGGINTSKVVYYGYQNPDLNEKQYIPKFFGVAKKTAGGTAFADLVDPKTTILEFDWSVSGRYIVAKCTLEIGPIPFEREFVPSEDMEKTMFDDSLSQLMNPYRIPVTLGDTRDLTEAEDKISKVATEMLFDMSGDKQSVYGFFAWSRPERKILLRNDVAYSVANEKCTSCDGKINVWEFSFEFDPGSTEFAQVFTPLWLDEPQYENNSLRPLAIQQIANVFSSTASHELQHQAYYMNNRNIVLAIGKQAASTKYRIAACEKTGLTIDDAKEINNDFFGFLEKAFATMINALNADEKLLHQKIDQDHKYCKRINSKWERSSP